MNEVDVIIVGQGITGTALAYKLIERGKTFHIYDKGHQNASSKVAAGLVNPVTGRRFTLSWRYPELRYYAESFYAGLQEFLEIQILKKTEIIRSVHKTSQWNDWQSRLTDPIYQPYVGDGADLNQINKNFNVAPWSVSIRSGLQIDLPKLITSFRFYLKEVNAISEIEFEHDTLILIDGKAVYKDFIADHVIFCEGAGGLENPLFNNLPFNLSKGEVFIMRSDSLDLKAAYKNRIFFIPLDNHTYWVGSYDRWKFDDEFPTTEGANALKERIGNIFTGTYEIIDHLSAVRPTVKDRRPFIGQHPKHSNIWICNGMGTKGTLMAPYFSDQLLNAIYAGGRIDKEVDIARYQG